MFRNAEGAVFRFNFGGSDESPSAALSSASAKDATGFQFNFSSGDHLSSPSATTGAFESDPPPAPLVEIPLATTAPAACTSCGFDSIALSPQRANQSTPSTAHHVAASNEATVRNGYGVSHHETGVTSLRKTRLCKDHLREVLPPEAVASDLVPGVYEGGFKLWECAVDLARFVLETSSPALDNITVTEPITALSSWGGLHVLELGCGHGLPGIAAALRGAAAAHFQDYNADVLRVLTVPNLLLNGLVGAAPPPEGRPTAPPALRLFAGDWGEFAALLLARGTQYDVVLSSDTLYSTASIPALVRVMRAALKPRTSVAYIAAKTYYFGVGGGTTEFRRHVEAPGSGLSVRLVRTYADGSSNVRELLAVTRTD